MGKKHWVIYQNILLEERLKKRNRIIQGKRPETYDEITEKRKRKTNKRIAKQRLKEAQEPFKDKETEETKLDNYRHHKQTS